MADEEFMSEYKLTLSELVTNAKITINVLSMLADENKKFAPQIAEAVEERIRTATPSQKLPALYLVDSIIKNVKDSDYLKIFTKNIVSLFVCVFERGDERIRSAMYKLRQTWVELFPNDVLLKLDLAVNSIDPAWPITAVRPVVGQQAVHLNPDFLNKAKEALKGLTSTSSLKGVRQSDLEKLGGDGKEERAVAEVEGGVPVSGGSSAATLGSEAEMLFQKQLMAKQLLAKQQELLQIQQRRVEIELAKAQMQIEQAKQLALQKPKQSQEVSINDAGEDKSPKKSKAKRSRTSSGAEDAEESKGNEKAPEEPAMTSPLKSKSPVKAAAPAKTELGAQPVLLSTAEPSSIAGAMPEKPQAKKRKSGDAQKVDPRLRKKMMLNKDGASTAASIAKPSPGAKTAQGSSEKPRVGVDVNAVGTKMENAKVAKEVTLSEDLKDLFGNVDKDFRTQMPSVAKTSLPDTQWKVLKSEGQNVPAYNFAHHKVIGGERRMNINNNRFGPYGKHLGAMHCNRKTLLPTPAPIFGQDLKPRQATVDNFEKLQEMKRELDVEAERLNSLSYDASTNGDFEAFEADVMRGNNLLNKARWNNWRHQERGAKRPRRQAGGEQFHNGPPFGNRPPPPQRSLLPAPPRVANFSEAQQHRPSPPRPQFPHQPSPPQFNQPRSPGHGNFGHGHNDYRGDDYNFDHYGGDRYDRETHYRDENRRSPVEGSWGGYHQPNSHNPPLRPLNPIDWRKPGPQQAFSQSSNNTTTSVTKGTFGPGHLNNFNNQNNAQPLPGTSQSSEHYVQQLFSKLTKFGFLNNIIAGNTKQEQEKIPKMSDFDLKHMKTKYRSLIDELSAGTLCRTCGLTFPPTKGVDRKKGEEQAKARYLMHLDWHFQVNKKANSIPKAERCREYYPDLDTWYRHEVVNVTRIPIEDGDEGDVKKEDAGSSSVAGKSKCIDAAEDRLESMKEKYKADLSTFVYKNMVKENEKCFICHEDFESYWDDEKEEWGLRDAYMLKEKLFHSRCFLEYEEHDMSVLEQQSSTTQPIPNDNEQALEEDIGNKVEASGGKILDEGAVLPNVESSTEEVKVFEESDDNKCIPDLV